MRMGGLRRRMARAMSGRARRLRWRLVWRMYPGYDDVWARGVYHCLFCDGYEDRGVESAGVLALGELGKLQPAVHTARMAKRLTSSVTIYTDGDVELESQIRNTLGKDPFFKMDGGRVTRLEKAKEKASEVIVYLQDGSKVVHGFVAHKHKPKINGPFVEQLGLELADTAVINSSSPWYETSVSCDFAVGDCASPVPAVPNAMSMGAFAAIGLAGQLGAE
ncbi:hypothetical protein TI39_contig4193g00005 [Zymoseptoria brevis]|uniref:FAD/NAD(P)-binding domain-containing protein n=1 Tax=Zymoseptoria brevis TaxID=1047168 RepID=A0A0F4GAP4_9PEZI|nr:hypothetical protein TI39_contig4193g00005 [Zymoseptoria brevis]